MQPLPLWAVEVLRPFSAGKPLAMKLWPGAWWQHAAGMLRVDLVAARIEPVTSEGRLDFHALRHSYITSLAMAGVPTTTLQRLARLSTPLLLNRYAHSSDAAAQAAVASLPCPALSRIVPSCQNGEKTALRIAREA